MTVPRLRPPGPPAARAIGLLAVLLLGTLAGVAATFALPAQPAAAHAKLLTTAPPSGAVLDSPPEAVQLSFSEPIRSVASRIQVLAPDGERADQSKPAISGDQLSIPLKDGLASGTYIVSYRVISADNHPIAGALSFSVGQPSANAAAGAAGPAVSATLKTAMGTAHYLAISGLILICGPLLFLQTLWPRRLSRVGPAKVVFAGLALTTLGTIAELYLQIPYAAGGTLIDIDGETARDVLAGPYGAWHMARLGVLGALAVLVKPLIDGTAQTADRALTAILAGVGLVTWPIPGHPGSTSIPLLSIAADAAHLGAIALWLGGLVVLAAFLLRRADHRELGAILPVWSRRARWAVVVIIASGTVEAVLSVGSLSQLVDTGYGQLILAKVAILSAVLVAAGYAARLVSRRLAAGPPTTATAVAQPDPVAEPDTAAAAADPAAEPGPDTAAADPAVEPDAAAEPDAAEPDSGPFVTARRRLRATVAIELVGAMVVLGLAAALVQTTPSRSAQAADPGPATADSVPIPYSASLASPLYRLQVELTPAIVGYNGMNLYAYSPSGAPLKILEWRGTAELPDKGVAAIDIPLVIAAENRAVGQIALPAAGTWKLRFTLRTTEIDQATVTAEVPVR